MKAERNIEKGLRPQQSTGVAKGDPNVAESHKNDFRSSTARSTKERTFFEGQKKDGVCPAGEKDYLQMNGGVHRFTICNTT